MNRNGLLKCLSLPPSRVFCSLFSLCFRYFFAVRSSTCFVFAPLSGACFPAQRFLLSGRSWPLQLSATSPLFLWLLSGSLVSLSFPLELFLPLVACFASSIRLSSGWSLLLLSCGCLFFLSLPLSPVCCLRHFAPLSSLRWLCPALVPGFQFSLVLFCFRFPSVFFSLFVDLLRSLLLPSWDPLLGVQLPSLLVTCSEVSWPLVDILFGYWLCIFVVFSSSYAFHCAIPLPFSRRFLVFPCVLSCLVCSPCVSLLLVLHPLSAPSLLLVAPLSPGFSL